MFKALNEGGIEGIYEQISNGELFGSNLTKYLTEGLQVEEIHKFKKVIDKSR